MWTDADGYYEGYVVDEKYNIYNKDYDDMWDSTLLVYSYRLGARSLYSALECELAGWVFSYPLSF